MTTVFLNHIATSVPDHDVHQKFIDFAPRFIRDKRQLKLFQRMADRSQIAHRYSFLPPGIGDDQLDAENFYTPEKFPTTAKRMQQYKKTAPKLAFKALEKLQQVDDLQDITHVILVSCTGFYAPGLDTEIIKQFNLKPTVERTIIGFMGCSAAINGLKAAYHMVRSQPDAKVLIVTLELCTLHLQKSHDLETLLSFLLFADGCATALVSAQPSDIEINGFYSELLSEGSEQICWNIGDSGFEMYLSGKVPRSIEHSLSDILKKIPMSEYIEQWVVHPGGRSVLDAVQTSLSLNPNQLADSRAILHSYGNMSSTTVLFVLERIVQTGKKGHGCALAFGPGLSIETMQFQHIDNG